MAASPRYFSPCQTRLQQIENYLTIIGKLMAKLLFRLDIAKAIKRSLSALLMSVGDSLVLNWSTTETSVAQYRNQKAQSSMWNVVYYNPHFQS